MKHLPNLITLLNLLAGCFAIVAVSNGELGYASWFLILALLFDLLDGAMARLLNAQSAIGKQLDSLADVVSFGVAPGFIMYTLILGVTEINYLAYFGFLLPLFAALRLARFNIDPGQEKAFIGLPAPAAALMILSIPLALNCKLAGIPFLNELYSNPWGLLSIVLAVSILMVSPLRLFSLKVSSIYWKHNRARYILIVFALGFFLTYRFASIPFILILYIGLSQLSLNEAETE